MFTWTDHNGVTNAYRALDESVSLEYRIGDNWHDAGAFVIDWSHPAIDRIEVICDGGALKRLSLTSRIQRAYLREGVRVYVVDDADIQGDGTLRLQAVMDD